MKFIRIAAIISVISVLTVQNKVPAAVETIKDEPYFKVRYERPHMPASVMSKEAAAKHLNTYNRYIAVNKQRIAVQQRQLRTKLAQDLQRRKVAESLLKNDRRESARFRIADISQNVKITINNAAAKDVIDFSNCGMGLKNGNLNINDEIPVKISYAGTEADTTLKIVAKNNGRLGGKFINFDEENESRLVYITSLLEQEHDKLITKFAY